MEELLNLALCAANLMTSEGNLSLAREKARLMSIPDYYDTSDQVEAKLDFMEAVYERCLNQGKTVDLSFKVVGGIERRSARVLKPGTIIVLKRRPGDATWWESFFSGEWFHAAMVSGNNETGGVNLVEAPGLGERSRVISLEDWVQAWPYAEVEKALLVTFTLSAGQRRSLVDYSNARQVDVPFPWYLNIIDTKFDTDVLYCSALVWQAHRHAGQYLDLDSENSLAVLPMDLAIHAPWHADYYAVAW
jgi:uncharacterized protein YycO